MSCSAELGMKKVNNLEASLQNFEPHEIAINVVCTTSKNSDQPAHMRRLNRALASHLNIL